MCFTQIINLFYNSHCCIIVYSPYFPNNPHMILPYLFRQLGPTIPSKNFCIIKQMNLPKPRGKLSIVATPIGNLLDLTPNIIKCLFHADLIGCQDRRVAGHLYTLIKNKNIIEKMQNKFGTLGISNLMVKQKGEDDNLQDQLQKKYKFDQYLQMNDKKRRSFLSKLTIQQQKKFKIQFLKYRAKRIINKSQQFLYNSKQQKFDDLYGIQVSDYKHIQTLILRTKTKKGRGLLIPLNTYSETKMYDLVKNMLQSKHIAIVSDAGMPCISDPGWRMVRMIRQTMPNFPIEVIGGPSAIDIMITLAKSTTTSNSLSGRFEGFASPQISNITQQSMTYNKNLQLSKQKDFSIHFINSKKLIKFAHILQQIYGQQHKIILANQLTKKYERKFYGSLKQLNQYLTQENNAFQGVGQMSYLLYSDKSKTKTEELSKQKSQEFKNSRIVTIDVNDFVKCLKNTKLVSKQKAQLVSSIFGMNYNQSKNIVYSNTIAKRNKTE